MKILKANKYQGEKGLISNVGSNSGVELAKSGNKEFREKYKVGKIFGTSEAGAPAAYVKDKIAEAIEGARKAAAKELDDAAKSNSNKKSTGE